MGMREHGLRLPGKGTAVNASGIVAIAALSLGLLVASPSFAARTFPPPTTPGGGDEACVTACSPAPSHAGVNYKDCSDKLADLPHTTAAQVAGIRQQRIHIVPLCDYSNSTLTQQDRLYLTRGNVAGLDAAIAANPVLQAQLTAHGFSTKDVLGILLGSNAAVLYVHKL